MGNDDQEQGSNLPEIQPGETKPEEKRPVGRPSSYSPEIAAAICQAIATGTKGLRRLCEENEEFPNVDTLYQWLIRHKEFSDQYSAARILQADRYVEENIEIADDGANDWVDVTNRNGDIIGRRVDNECVNRSKLRVEERRWAASKLAPKKYGDATTIRGDKDNPLQTNLAVTLSEAIKKLEHLPPPSLEPPPTLQQLEDNSKIIDAQVIEDE